MDDQWPSKDREILVRAERLEDLQRKEEALADAYDAIERLKREVEYRLDEMNLQARWTREAQEKVERLRAALKPFADVATRVQHGFREGAALVGYKAEE